MELMPGLERPGRDGNNSHSPITEGKQGEALISCPDKILIETFETFETLQYKARL
jgi:hypothetical protein